MPSFQETLDARFPGALPEGEFVARLSAALAPLGFDGPNTIACVGVCRDEIAQRLPALIRAAWGEAFNFCSLAGMLFLGRTGFHAAHHHAPMVGGRERYLHIALSHVAIGEQGEIGACRRPGRPGPSSACGALGVFQAAHGKGATDLHLDPEDVEMSLLARRLADRVRPGDRPDLAELALITHALIAEDLDRILAAVADPARADWACVTGVQVHGPDGVDRIWVPPVRATVGGRPVTVRLA